MLTVNEELLRKNFTADCLHISAFRTFPFPLLLLSFHKVCFLSSPSLMYSCFCQLQSAPVITQPAPSIHSTPLHSFISSSHFSPFVSLFLHPSQQTFSDSLSCKLGCLSSLISKHVCLPPCLPYLLIQPTLCLNRPARCESRIKAAVHISELNGII